MDDVKRQYEILELPFGAPLEDIRQKYRDLAAVWHPDRFAHNPRLQQMALDKVKEINGAYNELEAYVKKHGPPRPSSAEDRKEKVAEQAAREKARAEKEARARAEREWEARMRAAEREKETQEKESQGKKPGRRRWLYLGLPALGLCLAASLLLFHGKGVTTTPDKQDVPPEPSRQESVSPPAPELPPEPAPAPVKPAEAPAPPEKPAAGKDTPAEPVRRPGLPAETPPAQKPQRETGAPPRTVRPATPPEAARAEAVIRDLRDTLPDRVYADCVRHSPADWCRMAADRCREYADDCAAAAGSDSSYIDSSACRGMREWCYKDPKSVNRIGTDRQ
jgi:hypothetical protein